jgi:hypothetical protein
MKPVALIHWLAAALASLAGCTWSETPGGPPPTPGEVATLLAQAEANPFTPTTLRIHPLTHVDSLPGGPGGSCVIVLHFELKDRYGDSVKAPGLVRVELAKPAEGVLAGMESRELTWEMPEFINADENFRRFDSPTRTYRVMLGASSWVCREATGRGSQWLKIRASIELPGGGAVLRDEYVIQ